MNDNINKFKDYVPLIALVPLVAGGFWQIMELASMSTSYIRFFSVTQQLADGLTILFVLFVFYLTLLIVQLLFAKAFNPSLEELQAYSIGKILLRILGMIFVFGVMLFYTIEVIKKVPVMLENASNGIISIGEFVGVIFVGSLLLFLPIRGLYFLILALIRKFTSFSINTESEFFQTVRYLLFAGCVIAFLRFLFVFFPAFHSAYMVPRNLKNIDYMLNKYSKENGIKNKKSLAVVYMNDKYIFIEDSSKIEVVKIDYMFKSDK